MKYLLPMLLVVNLSLSERVYASELLFVGSQFPAILEQQSDGRVGGVAADIIDDIMSHSSQTYQIVVIPWKRAQIMLQEGSADMLIGPYKSEQRQHYLDYSSTPFYIDQMVLYTWKGNVIDWQGNFSTLQHKLLGVPLGWTGGAMFESAKAGLRIYEVPELNNGLEMLVRKRLDLVLTNHRNAVANIAELNMGDKLTMLNPVVQNIKGYFGFAKKSQLIALKQLFEQKMAAMEINGTIKRINQKYGLEYNNF